MAVLPPPYLVLQSDVSLSDSGKDRLGRRHFAELVAKSILRMNADDGFVLALNGPWGSGKSTVKNFVLEWLGREPSASQKVVVVHFNPWWFTGTDDLLQRFFKQLQATLGGSDVPETLKAVGARLDQLAALLTPVKYIPGIGTIADAVKDAVQTVTGTVKAAGDAFVADFYAQREGLDALLRRQDARILVVIDDIDRLSAEEIRQVFRLVKSVADFPRTIYMLLFDREMVAAAMDKYQSEAGALYLEKIVQLSLDLPPVMQGDLLDLFRRELTEILQDTPQNLRDPGELENVLRDGVEPLLRNMRDVKRLANVLRVAYPAVVGEVQAADFVGIQTLRLFVPEAYAFAAANRHCLAGTNDQLSVPSVDPKEDRARFDSVLEKTTPEQRPAASDLLGHLFPRWATAFGASDHRGSFLAEWRKTLRICHPEVFDTYFRWSPPAGEISLAEMHAILVQAGNPEALAHTLLRLTGELGPNGVRRHWRLFERLTDHIADIPIKNVELVLTAIFTVGDELLDRDDRWEFSGDWILRRLVHYLLGRFANSEEGQGVLYRVCSSSGSLALMAEVINDLIEAKEPTSIGISNTEGLVGPFMEFRARFCEKVAAAAQTGALASSPRLGTVLHCWTDWSKLDAPEAWVDDLIKGDQGLATYLAAFLGTSSSQPIGEHWRRDTRRVDLVSVEKLARMKPADLVSRCETILAENPHWLTDLHILALRTFVDEVKNPRDKFGNLLKGE